MGYKTAYKEVMRAYEVDRNDAHALLEARREEMYQSVPRVKEIELRLREIGLSLARLALSGNEALLQKAREESNALQSEKASLMPKDYFTDIYKCAVCADTGYVENGSKPLERCACLKQRLIEKYYDFSNLRGVLEEENFDTFDFRYYSMEVDKDEGVSPKSNMQTIYEVAMKFTAGFGVTYQNLLLYGDTGLGKTFISNCVAKELLDKGRTVLYVTAPRLFKVIEDYRFNRDEMDEPDEMLEAVTDVDLFILDDLGTEFSTVVTSAALFDIINQRMLAKKPTIISTNLSVRDLEEQYTGRIGSRFLGNFDMLKFFGEDIRIKKKHKKRGS
jgi:DNA replication protein DnaC